MAGRGSRLRPHSLTVPKPLIPVAGKPIVHRLVADIAGVLNTEIENLRKFDFSILIKSSDVIEKIGEGKVQKYFTEFF